MSFISQRLFTQVIIHVFYRCTKQSSTLPVYHRLIPHPLIESQDHPGLEIRFANNNENYIYCVDRNVLKLCMTSM